MHLLVSGGYPKKDYYKLNEGQQFEKAFAICVNWETGKITKKLEYISAPEFSSPDLAMLFKTGTVYDGQIIIPTNTEIVIVDAESLDVKRTISNKTFADLHHVTVFGGLLHIANTGMEMVQSLDMEGNIIREYFLTHTPTWKNYPEGTDFRQIVSTKPHYVHVNHVFFLDEQPWCTRFLMKDAISLQDNSKRINLNFSEGGPHDGLVLDDHVLFTLTDGHIVIVSKSTLRVDEVIDLNKITGRKNPLGWCRGLDVYGNDLFVGFTRIRRSKFRVYGSWLKHGEKKAPARVAHYNMKTRKLIKEWEVGKKSAAIYTVKII
jgi:hypothetical protein